MEPKDQPHVGRHGIEKEKALKTLTDAYVGGKLTMDEFEEHAALIERSLSIDEVSERLSRAIGAPAQRSAGDDGLSDLERLACHGSSKRLSKAFLETRRLEMDIAHSSIEMDYTDARLPHSTVDVVIRSAHSKCRIILPEGVHVEDRTNQTYSSIVDRRAARSDGAEGPTLRISGDLIHSKVVITGPKESLARKISKMILG